MAREETAALPIAAWAATSWRKCAVADMSCFPLSSSTPRLVTGCTSHSVPRVASCLAVACRRSGCSWSNMSQPVTRTGVSVLRETLEPPERPRRMESAKSGRDLDHGRARAVVTHDFDQSDVEVLLAFVVGLAGG